MLVVVREEEDEGVGASGVSIPVTYLTIGVSASTVQYKLFEIGLKNQDLESGAL